MSVLWTSELGDVARLDWTGWRPGCTGRTGRCGCVDMGVVCGVWDVVCGMWYVGCGMWDVVCGMWYVGCGMWDVVCGVWDVVCGV